jgi:hypothetical protein
MTDSRRHPSLILKSFLQSDLRGFKETFLDYTLAMRPSDNGIGERNL